MHMFTARPPEEKNALIPPLKDGLCCSSLLLYLDSGPVFTAVAIITAYGTRYFTFKHTSHKMKRIVTLLDPLVFESLLGQSN